MSSPKLKIPDVIKYRLEEPKLGQPGRLKPEGDPWPKGYLYTSDEAEQVPGMVREINVLDSSEDGARIRSRKRVRLPDIVSVRAPCFDGTKRAFVSWQTGLDAGLVFT